MSRPRRRTGYQAIFLWEYSGKYKQQTLLYRYGKREVKTTIRVVAHVDGTFMQ